MKKRTATNKIVLHCTATNNIKQHSVEAIRELHTSASSKKFNWGLYKNTPGKEFSDIGYHILVDRDGKSHTGRKLELMGAGARGYNWESVHIALMGNTGFTLDQFIECNNVILSLFSTYDMDWNNVFLHSDLDKKKTCPNFGIEKVIFQDL